MTAQQPASAPTLTAAEIDAIAARAGATKFRGEWVAVLAIDDFNALMDALRAAEARAERAEAVVAALWVGAVVAALWVGAVVAALWVGDDSAHEAALEAALEAWEAGDDDD